MGVSIVDDKVFCLRISLSWGRVREGAVSGYSVSWYKYSQFSLSFKDRNRIFIHPGHKPTLNNVP